MMKPFFAKFSIRQEWIRNLFDFEDDDIVAIIHIKHMYISCLFDMNARCFLMEVNSTRDTIDSFSYEREYRSWKEAKGLRKDIVNILKDVNETNNIEQFKSNLESIGFKMIELNGEEILL